MKLDKQKKELILLIFSVFIIILCFSYLSPLAADDYDYSFSMSSGLRVSTFYELFRSMKMHRYHINGRYFSHLFAMFFLWMPKMIFNIVNACMASALVYVVFIYMNVLFREKSVKYTLIWCILFFCFTPTFGQVVLWLDGACNYLWSFVFILVYLLPFFCLWFNRYSRPTSVIKVFGLISEAFIAGAYSEIGSLMALFISFCILGERLLKKKKIPKELLLNFIFACVGFLFLFFAPATLNHRLRGADNTDYNFPLFSYIKPVYFILFFIGLLILLCLILAFRDRKQVCFAILFGFGSLCYLILCSIMWPNIDRSDIIHAIGVLISESSWNVLTITFLCYLAFLHSIGLGGNKRQLTMAVVLILASLLSVAVMQAARYMAARMFSYYVVFLSLGSIIVLQRESYEKKLQYGILAICILFFLHLLIGSYDIININRIESIRKNRIIEAKISNAEIIRIPLYNPISKYSAVYGLDDVKDYEEGWPNQSMCDYYEVNVIISE